jgi:putative intracellular protease/amidase
MKENRFLTGRVRRSLLCAEGCWSSNHLGSPKGGQPPTDPKSDLPENQTKLTKRFPKDTAAQAELANTQKLAEVSGNDFDAVFYPSGHSPGWNMPDNATSIALIEAF